MGNVATTKAYAMKSATVSTAVKAITDASFSWGGTDLSKTERARITARSAGVMYTYDGTDPTATVGQVIAQNGVAVIDGTANIKNLKFLREAGVDVVVTVTLEK